MIACPNTTGTCGKIEKPSTTKIVWCGIRGIYPSKLIEDRFIIEIAIVSIRNQ